MARPPAIAIILGAALLAGCSSASENTSMAKTEWIDSNCTGNGFISNPSWCTNNFRASMGPYAVPSANKT